MARLLIRLFGVVALITLNSMAIRAEILVAVAGPMTGQNIFSRLLKKSVAFADEA